MSFRGYGGDEPPNDSYSYFGPHGFGDDRTNVASNVVASSFRPTGYAAGREHDVVRSSGQESWNQTSYSSFKKSEDILRVTVGNSLYIPPGNSSNEADNGTSNWGRGSAQCERTVKSVGSLPGVHSDARNEWNMLQPEFATRRGVPVPSAHGRYGVGEVGSSHLARHDGSGSSSSSSFGAGRTTDFSGQRDSVSSVWQTAADTAVYNQQSSTADHLGFGANLSVPKSILKSKAFGQSALPAERQMPSAAAERLMPSATASDGVANRHVGAAAPNGSAARAALQAQSLLVAAAEAAASGAAGSSSVSARAQVFDYGHSKPDVLLGGPAVVLPSGLQGGPSPSSSAGPNAAVRMTNASQTAGMDLMQDPVFDQIIKSMGVDFDPKKKLQERARALEQQAEEAARRKRKDKTEEEMARQFGINKTASFLEGGDLDLGSVLGNRALVAATVLRSTGKGVQAASTVAKQQQQHHHRIAIGAQSSVPELCSADASLSRALHPDQESGKSQRGGASPSRKSLSESDTGRTAHTRDGRSSGSGRSGGVGDRYDDRLARSLSREAAVDTVSERGPGKVQNSRTSREPAEHRFLPDTRQVSGASPSSWKGDRNRNDAVDVEAQRLRRGNESSRSDPGGYVSGLDVISADDRREESRPAREDSAHGGSRDHGRSSGDYGSTGNSSKASAHGGGGGTSETVESVGVLTREEHEKLKVEMEDRRRRLRLLEGELDKLRRQQNELMRKHQQRGGTGRRDPFIDENTRLQEDISKQIAQLRKTAEANERALEARLALSENAAIAGSASTKRAISGSTVTGGGGSSSSIGLRDRHHEVAGDDVVDRLSSHFSRDQAKGLSLALGDASAATVLFRTLLQFHPSLREAVLTKQHQKQPPFEGRTACKLSSTGTVECASGGRQSSSSTGTQQTEGGIIHDYYDSTSHWCKPCNIELPTLSGLLEHLASDVHKQALEQPERPWASAVPREPSLSSKPAKKESATIVKLPLKGSEFVLPAPQAFYCRLCATFAGDQRCMEAHIKGSDHNDCYKKYISDNPFYERRYNLDREASARLRKRRQDEEACLADRAKRQRLDDELVNKKLEALKTRHRQCDIASSTTVKPEAVTAESGIAGPAPAAAKESPSISRSTTANSGDGSVGIVGQQQRDFLQGIIKKEPSDEAESSAVAADQPARSRDDGCASKKIRVENAGNCGTSALKGQRSAADPLTEHCAAGRPISVVVGKKSVESASSFMHGSALGAILTPAEGAATVRPPPERQASGAASGERLQQVAKHSKSSASFDKAVTADRTAAVPGGHGTSAGDSVCRAQLNSASADAVASKPPTSSAQPGGLTAGGIQRAPTTRPAIQTAKSASPSTNRGAAVSMGTPAAAFDTRSVALVAHTAAARQEKQLPSTAAAVPANPVAKNVGRAGSVQQTTSPSEASVRPAMPSSSTATVAGPVSAAAKLGVVSGCSQPQSAGKATPSASNVHTRSSTAAASKQATAIGPALAGHQQPRPIQQHQARSSAVGASAPIADRGKSTDGQQVPPAVGALADGSVKASDSVGSSLAAATAGRTAMASAAGSSPAPVEQWPLLSAKSSPPTVATCEASESTSSSASISQSATATAVGLIATSQSAADTKPVVPATALASEGASPSRATATAVAVPTADNIRLETDPLRSLPSSPAHVGNGASVAGRGQQETAAKTSPAAPAATSTTTAVQRAAAKPDSDRTGPANSKPPAASGAGAASTAPPAGGRGSTANVSTPRSTASKRPGATAATAIAPLGRTRTDASAVSSNSSNNKQAAAKPLVAASASVSTAAVDSGSSKRPALVDRSPAADLPRASDDHPKRTCSLPATRRAVDGDAKPAASAGGARQAEAGPKPAPVDCAAAKSAATKPAGVLASSTTPVDASNSRPSATGNDGDASDLEGDGSVSGADDASADDLSMDGDFEILDEYAEHEEHS